MKGFPEAGQEKVLCATRWIFEKGIAVYIGQEDVVTCGLSSKSVKSAPRVHPHLAHQVPGIQLPPRVTGQRGKLPDVISRELSGLVAAHPPVEVVRLPLSAGERRLELPVLVSNQALATVSPSCLDCRQTLLGWGVARPIFIGRSLDGWRTRLLQGKWDGEKQKARAKKDVSASHEPSLSGPRVDVQIAPCKPDANSRVQRRRRAPMSERRDADRGKYRNERGDLDILEAGRADLEQAPVLDADKDVR